MADEDLTVPSRVDDLDLDDVAVEAELVDKDAEREIDRAVRGRRGIARKYVRGMRRHHPDATPAEIISMLEHRYVTAISIAGAAITVGSIAAGVGIAAIPVVGAAAAGGKAVAKEAVKAAAKSAARDAARSGARRAKALLPAGASQLQFEITAIFGLALADIHGKDLDQAQAHALVYLLSNGRVSQQQIAAMASDLARSSTAEIVDGSQPIIGGREDLAHWADTLADSLPGGAAQTLVRGVQTGVLDDTHSKLDDRHPTAVNYGAGALVGGITRFAFGREVVDAARSAFAEAPATFPDYLDVPLKPEKPDSEPNAALEALEQAAKGIGAGVSTRAIAVGTGAASAAGVVTRSFRRVDLDGDGVPDEPQALTAVKGAGGAIAAAAGAAGDGLSGLFKPNKHGKHAAGGTRRELDGGADGDATAQ